MAGLFFCFFYDVILAIPTNRRWIMTRDACVTAALLVLVVANFFGGLWELVVLFPDSSVVFSLVRGLMYVGVLLALPLLPLLKWREARRWGALRTLALPAIAGLCVYYAGWGLADGARPWSALVGFVLFAVGFAFRTWAQVTLGANWTPAVKTPATLVTHGPYAIVRHPIYSSYLLVGSGVSFMVGSWALAVATGLYILNSLWRIREEEAEVERRFPEYRAYRTRVPAVFPHVRRRRQP
ncbi:MAG: hypothetical protein A3G57_01570 [Candidatus Andersenbacteria bacterium RIFCSPLOWO2_12_FULL_45_8]|nr:MAG: hypothetical protein A3I74_02030 [Candidatus Magasanikbacteria bacterium RIFCSPLOWO2_02_FULL_47_16]OGH79706.1 MAG: hypothetical protein A3C10_01375 [Candidatus Magasanikbacteria bacterium RIFCSPHIGHO2_02_FULL_48_18]OGY39746.1 MAG: hypothetical protein A3G57_01570 [Candidatus Andersenbacteria bacterium RIFCSPLOWO2_12_FULL_45_8]